MSEWYNDRFKEKFCNLLIKLFADEAQSQDIGTRDVGYDVVKDLDGKRIRRPYY
jgi:hypothetical protein